MLKLIKNVKKALKYVIMLTPCAIKPKRPLKIWKAKALKNWLEKVQAALDTLKETLKGEDMEKIKADTEALTKPLYELSAELYKQTEAAKGAEGTETAEGAKKADDDVVDAEVVDEDKK